MTEAIKKKADGFFSVGRQSFIKACGLGVNAAATFLVMARGTGGDNITTKWSSEAASKRLGVRWTAADLAIKALLSAKVATRADGTKPLYKLDREGELIWLPNSIIDGVGGELPPIFKLRQMQDALAIRLFGELYAEQNLREDGGISRSVTQRKYTREKVGQQGAQVVWLFRYQNVYVSAGEATTPHRCSLTKKEISDGKSWATDYFRRAELLESAGLIEWVPYLFEGPEGEAIHPLAWNGMEIEKDLYLACVAAGQSLLTVGQRDHITSNPGGWLVPAPAHIAELQMFGIARLRYRPQTRMTAAWWADYATRCEQFTVAYRAISEARKAA